MALSQIGTASGSGTGTSASTSLHASAANGDWAFVFVVRDNGGAITINQSYAEQAESPIDDGYVLTKGALFAKLLAGSDVTPTLTFVGSGRWRWISVVYRGQHASAVQDCQATVDTGFSNNVPFEDAAAGGNTVWSLLFQGTEGNWTLTTAPTGYTTVINTGTGDYGCILFEDATVGTGTISPADAVLSEGKDDVTFHVLLREDGAGGPVFVARQMLPILQAVNRAGTY